MKQWSVPTTWDEVCKRASGRRSYNSWRKFMAISRRHEVMRLVVENHLSLIGRGTTSLLAGELGVSRVTIWRDIKAIMGTQEWPCPVCGTLGDWIPRHNDLLDD